MTAGHCVPHYGGRIRPGKFLYRKSSSFLNSYIIPREFSVLDRDANDIARVKSDQLIYATATKTDLAFYQLTITYRQFEERFGFGALTLSSDIPNSGTEIEILSGIWKRRFSCFIDFIPNGLIIERRKFESSIRYTEECHTKTGASGAPILDAQTRLVIGIHSHSSGTEDCKTDVCEVDDLGNVKHFSNRKYGQQTALVYSCLNDSREIDLSVPGCKLPGGKRKQKMQTQK